jgi:predicted ATP-grasp superfamily ATP-dependent carboligase
MADRLVHIVDDAEVLADAGDLTLVVVLTGFLDAGKSAELAARHLSELAEGKVVATFDVDALHDYRARRPPVTFVRDHYTDYEAPRLAVRAMRDTGGTPFLLLVGPEPDIRWEAFARAVREVVEHFGVARVVSLGAVPMAVPHTRPIAITPHANRPELVPGESPWQSELRVPASAQALLEVRLGEWGHDALGFVAHVPHYLAQMEYPQAALVLLEHLEVGGHLTIDLSGVREAAEITETEVDRYLASHDEVGDVVRGLEQQYDSFREAEAAGSSLLAGDEPLPTGEEIGSAFEAFLADLDDQSKDNPDETGGADRGWRAAPPNSPPCSTSTSSRSICSEAPRRAPSGSGSSAARWPPRPSSPPPAAWRASSSSTRCTPTSSGPATPPSRSSTTSSASATAAPSRPGAWSRASTVRRSST